MLRLLRSTLRIFNVWNGGKGKEIHSSLAVTPQITEVTVTMCNTGLVKMKKELNFWVEDMSTSHVPAGSDVLLLALRLCQMEQEISAEVTLIHLLQEWDGYT